MRDPRTASELALHPVYPCPLVHTTVMNYSFSPHHAGGLKGISLQKLNCCGASIETLVDESPIQVLAGALQDDCRAVLRGERTFGKGLVQAVYGLADGQGLILTVAQYETPRGTYIHVRSASAFSWRSLLLNLCV